MASVMFPRLTFRQIKAIDAFFANGGHKKDAAMAAGYSDATASVMFQNEGVQKEIERRRKLMEKKSDITLEYLIDGYKSIVEGNIGVIIRKLRNNGWDLDELSEKELWLLDSITQEEISAGRGEGAVAVLKTKLTGLKMSDKKGALDSLARVGGHNVDKVSVSADDDFVKALQEGRARARAPEGE